MPDQPDPAVSGWLILDKPRGLGSTQAVAAVKRVLREAGYGMGGTKWQVIRSHVLANPLPGILTGTILAMSRAVGEARFDPAVAST